MPGGDRVSQTPGSKIGGGANIKTSNLNKNVKSSYDRLAGVSFYNTRQTSSLRS